MKRGILLGLTLLALLIGVSCSSTKKASVSQQRAGLLMLEGENIYKNKGFYKAKKSKKHRKRTYKASKRKYKR